MNRKLLLIVAVGLLAGVCAGIAAAESTCQCSACLDHDSAAHSEHDEHSEQEEHDEHDGVGEHDEHDEDDGHDEHDEHDAHDEHEGHEGERGDEGQYRVELSAEQRERIRFEVATAGPGTIVTGAVFPGEIILNPDRIAHVVPQVAGIVREVAKTLGDHVQAGEILAWLESDELAEAKFSF